VKDTAMEEKNERFQLVIPSGVLVRVRELAVRERRSISNMIVVLLEEALKARDTKAKTKEEENSQPVLLAA
jgi:hypothetical protein